MQDIDKYITLEAKNQLESSIRNAKGEERFFIGNCRHDGKVSSVRFISKAGARALMFLFNQPQSGEVVIHNQSSGDLTPSSIDDQIRERFHGKGVGVFLIDNYVEKILPMIEPFREGEELTQLSEANMAALLSSKGPLAETLPAFEEREEQMNMIKHVTRAFNLDQILLIEAGTGTGKSLAYLLPAIHWAKQNQERVLVSTNTINLQEQLFWKDIPFLKKVLKTSFNAALVKGRQNYLCLRKLNQLEADPEVLEKDKEFQKISKWSKRTLTGDRSELDFIPSMSTWPALAAESESCQRSRCAQYEECFYYLSRRKQEKADILITNHHVLFADLSLRKATNNYNAPALLPPYKRIILDEAHNIEDAASAFLGYQVSRLGIVRCLRQLAHKDRKKGAQGLLSMLHHLLAENEACLKSAHAFQNTILDSCIPETISARVKSEGICQQIHNILLAQGPPLGRAKTRVTEHFKKRGPWSEMRQLVTDLALSLLHLSQKLSRLETQIHEELEHASEKPKKLISHLMDVKGGMTRLANIAQNLLLFFEAEQESKPTEQEEWVQWFEFDPKDDSRIKFLAAPLEINSAMESMLYDAYGSIVFSSATLATEKTNFEYISQRVGIDRVPKIRLQTARYDSPFDYGRQTLIGIPNDLPSPKDPAFDHSICDVIFQALRTSGGRAFVLSTSFKQLTFLYEALRPRLQSLGISSLCQGKAQRHVLLQKKIQDPTSVLFGTDSFWEGVDVKGKALNNVILTRLPFRVPSEPLVEARIEAIEKKGENPFAQYTIPAAIIKFKQGFGRLIRSREDYGTVLILDKRVAEQSYGKRFLRALPHESPKLIGSTSHILSAFERFHRMAHE